MTKIDASSSYHNAGRDYAGEVWADDYVAPSAPASGGRAEPLPLFPKAAPAKPYPLEALGEGLGAAARAIASKVQCPESMAAQSVLAVAALASQAHADVMLPYGQTRPLSLFCLTIAGSGDRKTSADREALWPIRKHEKQLRTRYDEAMPQFKIDSAAWQAQKRKIEIDNCLGLEGRKAKLVELGPEPRRPLYPFLTAPDPTLEGLNKTMVDAPASMGIFSAEGGQFIGGSGMSDDNRLRTAAGFSRFWDGEQERRVRAGDGVTILEGRRLAMHLMAQPEAAGGLLRDKTLRDQGMLSRLLVAAPDSIAGTRLYRSTSASDEEQIRAYGALILYVLETPWPMAEGKRNELLPRALEMEPEASLIWQNYFNHVERQNSKVGDLEGVGDIASKSAEQAARIAGVLTIIDDPYAVTIATDTMERACALADWYLQEALRLHGASASPALISADNLLRWLAERGAGTLIAFRDVMQFGPGSLRTKAALDAAIQTLISHGWVAETSAKPRTIKLLAVPS